MLKRFFILLIFLVSPLNAWAQGFDFSTSAEQVIVVDDKSGQVLFAKNAESRMPTSSMSKVMTMLVVFDALKEGALRLDDEFIVSEKAWRKGGSKMFVEVDKKVRVEDLIRGVIVQSGNDATIVLAEGLAGSEEAFAEKLNEKAADIGMANSNFTNASGWPDENHYSTAQDLAIMARYLVHHYPEYYKYYGETSFSFNNIEQQNRNPLLYRNMGADGIKTGHTEAGGYGLIGTAIRDERRVIMVVNGLDSERARAQESAKILEWGLAQFEAVELFQQPTTLTNIPIAMGKKEHLAAEVSQALIVTIPRGARNRLEFSALYKTPLVAPIKKGDNIGVLQISMGERILGKVSLKAANDVLQANFFSRTLTKMKQFMRNG